MERRVEHEEELDDGCAREAAPAPRAVAEDATQPASLASALVVTVCFLSSQWPFSLEKPQFRVRARDQSDEEASPPPPPPHAYVRDLERVVKEWGAGQVGSVLFFRGAHLLRPDDSLAPGDELICTPRSDCLCKACAARAERLARAKVRAYLSASLRRKDVRSGSSPQTHVAHAVRAPPAAGSSRAPHAFAAAARAADRAAEAPRPIARAGVAARPASKRDGLRGCHATPASRGRRARARPPAPRTQAARALLVEGGAEAAPSPLQQQADADTFSLLLGQVADELSAYAHGRGVSVAALFRSTSQ